MAKTTIKEIHIRFPKKDYLQYFIEVLSSALKYVEFTLSYKHDGVKVKLYGERELVLESIHIVKTLGKTLVRSVVPNSEGFYIHNLKLIQQIGSKIISLDSLRSVLHYSGISSSIRNQDLITKATMEEVQSIVSHLYDLIQELPLNIRTQIMKQILLTVSYCTNLSPEFVLNKGLEMDYFQHSKNSIIINYKPEKIIEELISKLSDETTLAEHDDFSIKNIRN